MISNQARRRSVIFIGRYFVNVRILLSQISDSGGEKGRAIVNTHDTITEPWALGTFKRKVIVIDCCTSTVVLVR